MNLDEFQIAGGDAGKPLRAPYLMPGGTLVIPFDSDPDYHWWKGGQSVKHTRAEVLARMGAARAVQGTAQNSS
jgi:hypothetical protein